MLRAVWLLAERRHVASQRLLRRSSQSSCSPGPDFRAHEAQCSALLWVPAASARRVAHHSNGGPASVQVAVALRSRPAPSHSIGLRDAWRENRRWLIPRTPWACHAAGCAPLSPTSFVVRQACAPLLLQVNRVHVGALPASHYPDPLSNMVVSRESVTGRPEPCPVGCVFCGLTARSSSCSSRRWVRRAACLRGGSSGGSLSGTRPRNTLDFRAGLDVPFHFADSGCFGLLHGRELWPSRP